MTTSPIGNSTYEAPVNERMPLKTLGQEEFIKLLTTQLANQDPFKPQDGGEMLTQMSQIASIQSMTMMQEKLTSFGKSQDLALGQGLINKNVQVSDSDANLVTGIVEKVVMNKDGVQLMINGTSYPVSSLQSVLPETPTP